MTVDAAGFMFSLMVVGLSFIAARSAYYPMKFIAGLMWVGIAVFWMGNAPVSITKGSSVDVIITTVFWIIAIAFGFMGFWYSKNENGQEVGKGFKVTISRLFGKESEERKSSYFSGTHEDRARRHEERVNAALRGERDRRNR